MNRKLKLIILAVSLCIMALLALGVFLTKRMTETTSRLDRLAARSDEMTDKISRLMEQDEAVSQAGAAVRPERDADPEAPETETQTEKTADPWKTGETAETESEEAAEAESVHQTEWEPGRFESESETISEAADGKETEAADEAVTEEDKGKRRPLPVHHVIFVGDSRTVGMGKAEVQTGDDCVYIGESGEGYDWFTETGIDLLDTAIRAYPDSPVIYNLGVNDCSAVNAYIEVYHEMEKAYPNTEFYYMSVNPVTEDSKLVPNTDIIAFNRQLKNAFPQNYIDTWSWMTREGFEDVDGIHYSEDQYCLIHDYAVRAVLGAAAAAQHPVSQSSRN